MKTELKYLRKYLHNNKHLILNMNELKRIERLILLETYCNRLRQSATRKLAKELNYSERSIKRIRRNALEKLYIRIGEVLEDGT